METDGCYYHHVYPDDDIQLLRYEYSASSRTGHMVSHIAFYSDYCHCVLFYAEKEKIRHFLHLDKISVLRYNEVVSG